MKKTLSLILVLIFCFVLYACGSRRSEQKYVGTYTAAGSKYSVGGDYGDRRFETTYEMKLHSNGTGTLTLTATESAKSGVLSRDRIDIKEGDILLAYELDWKVMDGYLVVNGTGQQFYTTSYNSSYHIIEFGSPTPARPMSESFELKGNKLFFAGASYASYTKVD